MTSPPPPPEPTGHLRAYLAPLLAALVLIAMIVAWGVGEWRQMEASSLDRQRRFAEGFAAFVDVALYQRDDDPLMEPGRVNELLATLLARTPPLRTMTLRRGAATLAHAGAPLPPVALGEPAAEQLDGSTLIIWRNLRSSRDELLPAPPVFGARAESSRAEPPRIDPAAPLLIMVVETRPTGAGLSGKESSLLLRLLFALVGVIAMITAWIVGIRARRIAAALDVARAQKSHLEELSFAAAGLAHETRNPLGIIRGIAQRITTTPTSDDTTRRLAEQIIDAADRATERLGEFLHFARIKDPERVRVPARATIESVLDVLRYDGEAAGVTLDADVADVVLWCDGAMLKQVLVNLLLNSLEASHAGGRILVRLTATPGRGARLDVADSGRGIPEELRPDVFKPYVTGTSHGHGLGLAIVRRIVDLHGWRVDLQSEVGVGTTVSLFDLPLADALTPAPEPGHDAADPDRR